MSTELHAQPEEELNGQVRTVDVRTSNGRAKKADSTTSAADEPSAALVVSDISETSDTSDTSDTTIDEADNAAIHEGDNSTEDQFALLRELILGSYHERVAGLQDEIVNTQQEMDEVLARLNDLSVRIDDKDALLETISPIIANSIRSSIQNSRPEMIEAISPIMADTIRTNIRNSKEQMVEALYPILGQLVQRSVREAMKDLVRRIDNQIQSRISFRSFFDQIQARLSGVSPGEMVLRTSLPFDATDLFLIHRHSGLLLLYVSDGIVEVSPEWSTPTLVTEDDDIDLVDIEYSESEGDQIVAVHALYDTDLISGMLTAIRDFVHDAFGNGAEGNLDQVAYGDKQILIETAQNSYMAIVVEGAEPYDFRERMRTCLIDIEHEFANLLPNYDGNATPFESKKAHLLNLLTSGEEHDIEISEYSKSPIPDVIDSATTTDLTTLEGNRASERPSSREPVLSSTFTNEQISSSPTPLSILIFINIIILLLWWVFH